MFYTLGYGLRCHRVLKSLCQLAGIKDLHVKIEGSGNVRKAVYAFMEAFQEQVRLAGANLGGIYQLICDLTVLDTLASAYNEVGFKKLPGKARFPHVEVCSHLTSFSPFY